MLNTLKATTPGEPPEEADVGRCDEESLLGACASILGSATARLYAPHCFAAQAYVTYLTVAGHLISEGHDEVEGSAATKNPNITSSSSTLPLERVRPLEPTTGMGLFW